MINRIRSYINRSEFLKNSLTLFTGTTIAQIIPLLISPILSRIYDPSDFGLLALYMSTVSLVSVFATGRYEMAIMLPKKKEDAINIVILSIFISVVLAIVLLLTVFFLNHEISNLLGNKKISPFLYFLPVSVFSIGFFKALMYWFNRSDNFKSIAVSKVVATSANSGVALIVGLVKKGSFGLLFGWIFGQLSSMLYLLKNFLKNDKSYLSYIRKVKVLALAKRYKKFAIFDTWSELLKVLSVQLPVIIITKFFGDEVTGYYSFTYTIILVPFSLIAFSMGQAFFKRANDIKDSNENVSNFTFEVFKKLVLISFIPLSIVGIFGDFIFPFIFGEEWIIAGKYSRLFSLWAFTLFLSSPLTNIFAIYERQRANFMFNVFAFVSRVTVLIYLSVTTKDHFLAISWYIISGFIIRFLYLALVVFITKIPLLKIFIEIFKYTLPVISVLVLLRYLII